MITSLIIFILGLIAFLIALKFAHYLYPADNMPAGRKVDIYLDNVYNRTATISHNFNGGLIIYDTLSLPINYRGKFYAVGQTNDGHTLMFIGRKKLYFLAHIAELIRKIVNTPEFKDPTIEVESDAKEEPKEDADNEQ